MKALWLSLGAAFLLSQPAIAGHSTRKDRMQQEGTTQAQPSDATQAQPLNTTQAQPSGTTQAQQSQQTQNLSQQLANNLKESGFRNIKIMPETFYVRAQDPKGNPIEMVVSPTSVPAMEIGRGQGSSMTGRSAAEQSSPKFMSGPLFDAMSAKLADTAVQSSNHEDVGTIKGIAIGENGSLSYVVTIGDNRDVAVNPAAMSMTYDDNSEKWSATVDATKKQIQSAPQVQYNQELQ